MEDNKDDDVTVSAGKFFIRKISTTGHPCKNIITVTYDGEDVLVGIAVLVLVNKHEATNWQGRIIKIYKDRVLMVGTDIGNRIETLNEIVHRANIVSEKVKAHYELTIKNNKS